MEQELICRACLTTTTKCISLFTTPNLWGKNVDLFKLIMACAPVKISKDDGLPTKICESCLKQLQVSFLFRMRVLAADEKLRRYVRKNLVPRLQPVAEGFLEPLAATIMIDIHNPNVQQLYTMEQVIQSSASDGDPLGFDPFDFGAQNELRDFVKQEPEIKTELESEMVMPIEEVMISQEQSPPCIRSERPAPVPAPANLHTPSIRPSIAAPFSVQIPTSTLSTYSTPILSSYSTPMPSPFLTPNTTSFSTSNPIPFSTPNPTFYLTPNCTPFSASNLPPFSVSNSTPTHIPTFTTSSASIPNSLPNSKPALASLLQTNAVQPSTLPITSKTDEIGLQPLTQNGQIASVLTEQDLSFIQKICQNLNSSNDKFIIIKTATSLNNGLTPEPLNTGQIEQMNCSKSDETDQEAGIVEKKTEEHQKKEKRKKNKPCPLTVKLQKLEHSNKKKANQNEDENKQASKVEPKNNLIRKSEELPKEGLTKKQKVFVNQNLSAQNKELTQFRPHLPTKSVATVNIDLTTDEEGTETPKNNTPSKTAPSGNIPNQLLLSALTKGLAVINQERLKQLKENPVCIEIDD